MTRGLALRALDVLMVALLAGSALAQVWTAPTGALQGGRLVHAVLVAVITLPLLVRHRHPAFVVVTVWVGAWLQYELGAGLGQPFFAGVLALYAVGAHAKRPQALAGAGVVGLVVLAIDIPNLAAGDPPDEIVPVWFVLGGVWAFGRWMRRRRSETAALSSRAERAEREREESTARAVAAERARIARELHDLVAHSMGIVVIQAQGAQRALNADLEAAREALQAIEIMSRNGLAEMRRLLVLLADEQPGQDDDPQPGLDRLPELVELVRAAGLAIDLHVDGDDQALPPGVQLTVYRIVQEALTNTLKHAAATRAQVDVLARGNVVEITVDDDGHGPRDEPVTGHGLVGMRERVVLYGGTLETGSSADGGFRLHARLPVNGAPA